MNPKAVVILSCLAFVSAGCSRSGADAVRIKELEERHGKLEKEHQGAATESRKLGSRLTQMEQELTEQLAESKKVAGEREEFHAELKKTTKDRDELGKTLAKRTEDLMARTKELTATIQDLKGRTKERDDLRVELNTRTKERDIAYQELQSYAVEVQSLLARMEATLQTNPKKTTAAPGNAPPMGP